MQLVDTHTHLYLDDYDPDRTEAVERAIAAGVEWMIFPNVNADSIAPMMELASKYPNNIATCIGLHPSDVKEDWAVQLDAMEHLLRNGDNRFVALGEIGMDLYWDKTYAEQQRLALERQLDWAMQAQLPVVYHCREALEPMLEVIGHD
ncbi:MAG: TatD family hydrolase, partial [Muribaculaceae bacterium]|nr:TatD family hydrolase [Muribaculaceae bacterium]